MIHIEWDRTVTVNVKPGLMSTPLAVVSLGGYHQKVSDDDYIMTIWGYVPP